jgi:GTPase SAR1 family protein
MSSLEAKIVILGSQGVGKTSLVTRYCKGAFNPAQITSTVGASFLTKRVVDSDTDTVVRLQIWDTGEFPRPILVYGAFCASAMQRRSSKKEASH